MIDREVCIIKGIALNEEEFNKNYMEGKYRKEIFFEDIEKNILHFIDEYSDNPKYILGCYIQEIEEGEYYELENFNISIPKLEEEKNFNQRIKEFNITKKPKLYIVSQVY